MSTADARHINTLTNQFTDRFGDNGHPILVFFAPGRVNLIGEYTDFTGGLVFPCGINLGTLLLIRQSNESRCRFASSNFELTAELEPSALSKTIPGHWVNYPLGVIHEFALRGFDCGGIDCLYSGNLPNGAGLSSSASIEVVTAFAINSLTKAGLPVLDLVKIAQAAENDFVGMQCGIMDQFAVAMARADHAMQLNCETLEYRQVPLQLANHALIVSNTNQRRELSDSAYNDRVAECDQALQILQPLTGIENLGQLQPAQLTQYKAAFDNYPVAFQRACHVCMENDRVRSAVPALEANDLSAFGSLMNASHDSLRDLFEVSSDPLNHLVRLAREQSGVFGSRLTGAGFGGCTISLVAASSIESFIQQVGKSYREATGLQADFYTVQAADGVRQIAD